MFDRIKERRAAARELAENLKEEHPEFAKEMEAKLGFDFGDIVQMFLPLILKWLTDWLAKQRPAADVKEKVLPGVVKM